MGKLEHYRNCIQKVLEDYQKLRSSSREEIEVQAIFDPKRDHYQIVLVGWQEYRRTYGCALHLDLKGEKVWIQHNGTEIDIANQLVELGIPKQDIVLGFQAPYKRKYTEFAVG